MKVFLVSVFLLLGLTFAVTPPASKIPGNNPEEQELKYSLTIKETDVVLKWLAKAPFEEANPLIQKIVFQAQKQLSDTSKPKK